MLTVSDVSAVIVTRGDVDLKPIIASLPFEEVIIWDNSRELDRKVFGRYLGVERASSDYVYVQDDDCIVPATQLFERFSRLPGDLRDNEILANVPDDHRAAYSGTGTTLVGFGSIFNKNLVDFTPYLERYPDDLFFWCECDRVFTGLNFFEEIFVGVNKLDYGTGDNRMYRRPNHGRDLYEVWRRVKALTGIRAEKQFA